ncbi:MAG TPA: helix-turn-helix domain-containing protein [Polyangiaceae bacterium]|nr:helix-turn-helix domain-containing protein [Polyangiaceae bacterium]
MAVSGRLQLDPARVVSPSRQRALSLARALVTYYATEHAGMTLSDVARECQRDPSTLYVAVERYRAASPELFRGSLADLLAKSA